VSSVEIERICNGVDSNIVETAAIGIPPSGGGPEQLSVAVVLKNSNITPQDIQKLRMSFNSALQKTLNPLFRVLINYYIFIKFIIIVWFGVLIQARSCRSLK